MLMGGHRQHPARENCTETKFRKNDEDSSKIDIFQ